MASPRPLFLAGLSGSGKTTVGRLVAERLGRPFADTDEEVEREAGLPVAAIFEREGEAGFRAREAAAVARAIDAAAGGGAVVALGGGALQTDAVGDAVRRAGRTVWLDADPGTLAGRLRGGAGRPLLGGASDVAARLGDLLARRRARYAEADLRVDAGAAAPAAIARRIAAWARLVEAAPPDAGATVPVELGERGYLVHVGRGLLPRLGEFLADRAAAGPAGLVHDAGLPESHVAAAEAGLRTSGFDAARVPVPAGEASKTLARVEQICRALVAARLDRRSPVVALGGGVAGDAGGLAAALLYRGVPLLSAPTTLLAMVDAAIGGKTAANLPEGKNLVGAFWQPAAVVADLDTLATLPPRELRAGLAEAVKSAVIGDAPLLDEIEARAAALCAGDLGALAEVVRRCAAVKAAIVSADEREAGARAHLNLGHTAGHAIETAAGGALLHGEAVALGLCAAARVSARLGLCGPEVEPRLRAVLAAVGLPSDYAPHLGERAEVALGVDKKRASGRISFVAVRAIGRVETVPLPPGDLLRILRERA